MLRRLPLLLMIAVSCSGGPTTPDDDLVEVTGTFSAGFEISGMKPCGIMEHWCFGSSEFIARYEATVGLEPGGSRVVTGGGGVFVRLRGRPSERGSYCHLGLSERTFEVVEVLEMRLRRPGDCS